MALPELFIRAAGIRARRNPVSSSAPPASAIASPTYNAIPGQPLWPAFEGPESVTLSERGMYAARCIETIANSISGLPFVAGNMTSRIPRPTSQMQRLLGAPPGGPNQYWSATKLWQYSITQWLILGKFAWLHEYDDAGRIVGLWPLMAQYIVPIVAPKGSKDGYFSSFRYGIQGSAGFREIKPADITYIWRPSQKDVRQPEAPLRLAAMGIVITQLLDQFDRAFLENGGVPSHMIVTPPFDDNDSRTAFRNQFRRRFGGPSNTGKAAFAETTDESGDFGQPSGPGQTVSVQVIGTTQKDAQLDVLRDSRIADTCVSLGVPLSILGNSRNSKYTNMATDRINYWLETVKPKMTELQDSVNLGLGGRLDGTNDIGWFDVTGVPELRPTPVFTEAGGLAAVVGGVISPDEYRKDRGLPPQPDGQGDALRTPSASTAAVGGGAEPGSSVGFDKPPAVLPGEPGVDRALPIQVDAVRTDLLGTVREQLGVELAAARGEVEARLAGRRGGRKRAHAELDLALAYDDGHWQRRMVANLTPACRAAGVGDAALEGWSQEITGAVREHLHMAAVVPDDIFEPSRYMDGLGAPIRLVDHSYVEAALHSVAAGELTTADVLGVLES